MPAYVQTAPYTDRRGRVICEECSLAEWHDRTAQAQAAAQEHNRSVHAYPPPLPIETEEPA
jgi:hypothetical protein